MRSIAFVIALICSVTLTRADKLEWTYYFNSPSIHQAGKYATIGFDGTRQMGEPGKASLPFFPVKIMLPPGTIATGIRISYHHPVKISEALLLRPFQPVRPVSEGESEEWHEDALFYSGKHMYPNLSGSIETQFYNGFAIALSSFTPVRYLPYKRQVMYYTMVTVTIDTKPDPDSQDRWHNAFLSPDKIRFAEELVQNSAMTARYLSGREMRTSHYDYLVITKNQYLSEFDTLVAFYQPRGIRMKLTSTESISAGQSGMDLQEKIRNYIISEHQSNGIDYVLIGGDKEVVPYRGFYCYVVSGSGYEDNGIPADLYYSALDGNWNTDGDSRWAEPDEDDLYPEVGVGRLTFSDTAELHNMLHKIILYQDNPVEGELTQPLLSGEYLYPAPPTYGSDYIRLLVGYRTDNGYTTQGIPETHPIDSLYDTPSYSWPKSVMINRINSGRPWVHHCGHANYNTVMRLVNADITNSNFSQVNGIIHNYPIIYTHGCICGGFDYTDCIAEKMIGIDNLAVAFVGNSRYGWFNQGTTDGPSEHLHREFVDAIYRDSLYHIGMAHLKSKSETAPFVEVTGEFEPGATRWCFYDNNVLGDPMMAVWTYEPWLVDASYQEMIPVHADSVVVHLSGPEGMIEGFTCSLYRNDTLFGTAPTNHLGKAVILPDTDITEGPVSLVISGFNILPQYKTLQVSDVWIGVNADWSDPDNWHSGQVPDSSSFIIIPAEPAGPAFPTWNSGAPRHCRAILIETGAQFLLQQGDTLTVGDN